MQQSVCAELAKSAAELRQAVQSHLDRAHQQLEVLQKGNESLLVECRKRAVAAEAVSAFVAVRG